MLTGKKILLGVCGSIAAYKAAFLTRLLVKEGAIVRVIMTPDATAFITPLTLSTLSKNPVLQYFVEDEGAGVWTNHVDLGLWADALLIAPATANTLSKLANGGCDNLLTATYLSARCPVYIAPAMDIDMWAHPATQQNIATLSNYGNIIIDVEDGELASGLEGKGRMAEPEHIVDTLQNQLKKKVKRYLGKNVLITAGPTQEAIDPVRFISNYSTGRMGLELAKAFHMQGATVTLIIGPNNLSVPQYISTVSIKSAADMKDAVMRCVDKMDIIVMSAAIADYTPVNISAKKIKKKEGDLSIDLKRTTDILKTVGLQKKPNQILVGFALETNNEVVNAKQKLAAKNLDLIVLNSLQDAGAGFAHKTNKVTLIDKHNNISKFELKSKSAVAHDILQAIEKIRSTLSA